MDKIITISREYGAGGHSIGQQVAKELGIPFYARDMLKATVQTSGFDPDMVEHDQEDVSSTNFFFKSICSFADASFLTPRMPSTMCRRRSFSISPRRDPA